MTDIAAHIRIYDPEPSDDTVKKRTLAVKELSAKFRKGGTVAEILRWANDLALALEAKGQLPEDLAAATEAAIKKQSTAFIRENQGLQMTVCAVLGAITCLEAAEKTPGDTLSYDVLAAGLWSALSFQPVRTEARIEALRGELMQLARQHVLAVGTSARARRAVPDFQVALTDGMTGAGMAEAFNKAASGAIEPLRANAAMDREELDLVWWLFAGWSELLDAPFGTEAPEAAAIAAGMEAGRLLRRLPADAHGNLVRRLAKATEPSALPELMAKLGGDRVKLATAFGGNTTLAACPAVFPLLTAIAGGDSKDKVKRPIADWALRALLESGVLHVTAILPSVRV